MPPSAPLLVLFEMEIPNVYEKSEHHKIIQWLRSLLDKDEIGDLSGDMLFRVRL